MGVLDWLTTPARNADVDPAIHTADGTSAREFPKALRGVMAGVAALALDHGGALRTAGTGNAYVVNTAAGLRSPRRGISILVEVDRANTDAATLNVDGTGPRPWLDMSGAQLPSGALKPGTIQRATWSETRSAWLTDVLGSLTAAAFDVAMGLWYLSLPEESRGLGPNRPYRNNGLVAWTGPDNPGFTLDSPEGRRLTLTLLKEALPTSSEGLEPGAPYFNNGIITFVPLDVVPPPPIPGDTPDIEDPLTVAANGTLSLLSQQPGGTRFALNVNGLVYQGRGSTPPFTVDEKAVTWLPGNAGFALDPSDNVVAIYSL